jgi:hypothetical protein
MGQIIVSGSKIYEEKFHFLCSVIYVVGQSSIIKYCFMENNWKWPEALDALTAAPAHHTLLLENDTVRVIDTLIPPGEITAIHTHRWPASLYVLSWSDFIRYDDAGNIMFDSRSLPAPPAAGAALWSEPLTPHALKNIGDTNLHIISVEIKK